MSGVEWVERRSKRKKREWMGFLGFGFLNFFFFFFVVFFFFHNPFLGVVDWGTTETHKWANG